MSDHREMPGGYNYSNFVSSTDADAQLTNSMQDHTCACRTSPRPGKFETLNAFRVCNKHATPTADLYQKARNALLEPGSIVHVHDKFVGSRIHNRVMLLLKKNGLAETWQAVSFCYHSPESIGPRQRQVHRIVRDSKNGTKPQSSETADVDLLCAECKLQPHMMINIQELWLMEIGGAYYKVGEMPADMFTKLRQQICDLFLEDMECEKPESQGRQDNSAISTSLTPADVHQTRDGQPRRGPSQKRTHRGSAPVKIAGFRLN